MSSELVFYSLDSVFERKEVHLNNVLFSVIESHNQIAGCARRLADTLYQTTAFALKASSSVKSARPLAARTLDVEFRFSPCPKYAARWEGSQEKS